MSSDQGDFVGAGIKYWYRAYVTNSFPGNKDQVCPVDILADTIGGAVEKLSLFVLDGDEVLSVAMMGTREDYDFEMEEQESSSLNELTGVPDWPMDGVAAVPVSSPEDGRKPEFYRVLDNK